MAQHRIVPPVDFKPTGRALPFIPEPARQHPTDMPITDHTGRLTPFGDHVFHGIAADLTAQADDMNEVIGMLPAVIAQAAQFALGERYTPELGARIAGNVIGRIKDSGAQPDRCPVYRDCTDTAPGHADHFAHDLKVTEDDDETPVITGGMVALSNSPGEEIRPATVYLSSAEFTDAASVHAKTDEIRHMLDQVDAMANRVFADHKARA